MMQHHWPAEHHQSPYNTTNPGMNHHSMMHPPAAAGQTGGPETLRRTRVIIKPPRSRFVGSPEFYGSVPKRDATFAWSELGITPDPECSLAPEAHTQKMWYNTYLYQQEQNSHKERHFLERFVQGPNGEWLDVVKARRMTRFHDEKRQQDLKDQLERQALMSGAYMRNSSYTDAYSGEDLIECRGELASRETLLQEHGVHRSATELAKLALQDARAQADWDNLRVPWPFGTAYRNKKVSQHTYDWFDRNHNPYVPTDKSVEIVELPSMYIDSVQHSKELAGEGIHHYPADEVMFAQQHPHIGMSGHAKQVYI